MRKLLLGLFSFSLLMQWGVSVNAEEKQAFNIQPTVVMPQVAAVVNGENIGMQVFSNELVRAAGKQVLAKLVERMLVEQAAEGKLEVEGSGKKRGKTVAERSLSEVEKRWEKFQKQFSTSEEMRTRLQQSGISEEELKQEIKIGIYREELLADEIKVSAKEAKDFFESNRERLNTPARIQLGKITVETESQAKDLQLSLSVGADFIALAKVKSLDAATREQGGELGVFSPGMLAPELENTLFKLEKGGSIILKDGPLFQVIGVLNKYPSQEAEWNKETEEKIKTAMRQQKLNEAYPGWLKKAQEASQIQINTNLGL